MLKRIYLSISGGAPHVPEEKFWRASVTARAHNQQPTAASSQVGARTYGTIHVVRYRSVGQNGVQLSEIGFGCGGTAGLMVRGTPREQVAAVARALELGINYFDNAPDYGERVAERNLGRVLRELGAHPYVTTKVEIRNENLDHIADHVVRSVEVSLRELQLDCVDFVQIHNGPVLERPRLEGRAYNVLGLADFMRPGGALEGLGRVKQAGKARHVGFIVRGSDPEPVQPLLDTGEFDLVNVMYHLINPAARGVIERAHKARVGVAVYSPLANGYLNDNTVAGGAPHPLAGKRPREEDLDLGRARALRFLSDAETTLAQAALRFVLMEPGVTTVLGGFSGMEHLEEAAPVPDAGPLSAEQMQRVQDVWRTNFYQQV
jgi:aryl-alcohol dehydrogenase-like predicted oxidoreductase